MIGNPLEHQVKVPLCVDVSGVARVENTRVTLDTVVWAYEQGFSAEEMVFRYPSLCLQDAYAVIAYYLSERERVERYLSEPRHRGGEIRQGEAQLNPGGLRARLAALRSSSGLSGGRLATQPRGSEQPDMLIGDQAAERAVLGGILLDPALLPMVSERLQPADFHTERHQVLYQAMLDLRAEQAGIDLRTLQEKLEQKAQLDLVGGLAYVASLDLDLPDLGRTADYLEHILRRSARRPR